ncbi:unnamed protein product [Auanema sp. JU1783]|nr:unnamed protein product [Auanema sp. JU1783]
MSAGEWCLIESDPGVFTELLKGFGVRGVQVEELYSLDEQQFEVLRPVLGLIFLFKWRKEDEAVGTPVSDENVFFAQQVITNACATQALVNMLLNVADPKVDLGKILEEYKEFTKDFDPVNRGLTMSNSEMIRDVHNSFTRPTLYELDQKRSKGEDNYHFVSYVPIKGKVYELDGLRETPLEVATVKEGGDWLEAVRPILLSRMEKHSEGEITFNLMAVVSDRKEEYIRRITELSEKEMMTDEDAQIINDLQIRIDNEDEKMKRYKTENARRRHDYLPFIVELMKAMAKEGKLVPFMEEAYFFSNASYLLY